MMLFLQFVLGFLVFLVIYNYLLYPFLLKILVRGKGLEYESYRVEELPKIAYVFAAYNEEKVILNKLRNLNSLDYPSHLLEIHIGLDAPSDATFDIIEANKAIKFPVFVHHFTERSGKANVLNKLFQYSLKLSDFELVILNDANIISKENCLFELVKYFKNPEIGIVGAVIENAINEQTEIAQQEKFYIQNESTIKVQEGILWGASMGAFGACYAIRSELIKVLPSNILMEDFYLSMHALDQGKKVITNSKAIVYEDLPGSIQEEFKRKRRISTGNFQNLKTYIHLLWKTSGSIAFTFFSHKILRWLSPIFILMMSLISVLLYVLDASSFWNILFFYGLLTNLFLAILDIALQGLNINVNLLRLHRYFILMNFAMFLGFIDWLKGVKTNIWKPTQRL